MKDTTAAIHFKVIVITISRANQFQKVLLLSRWRELKIWAYWSVSDELKIAKLNRDTLAGDTTCRFCSWARHVTLTVRLFTQVYKWVLANLMLKFCSRTHMLTSGGVTEGKGKKEEGRGRREKGRIEKGGLPFIHTTIWKQFTSKNPQINFYFFLKFSLDRKRYSRKQN